MSDVLDDSREAIKRQILDAYGFASEDELNAVIEEEFPSWLAAHAEHEAEQAAYCASLDERWGAYRTQLRALFGLPEPEDWLAEYTARIEQEALCTGELRYGGPRDWFRSIKWSPAAWTALHGADGPRGR